MWSSYQSYIGIKKAQKWLYMDFILGYFGNKMSEAQIGYRGFVDSWTNKKYISPLSEMVSSTILGSAAFIVFVKDNYLKGKIPDKNVPALSALADKVKIEDIFDAVDSIGIETYFLDLLSDSDSIRIAEMENTKLEKNATELEAILTYLIQNTKVNESDLLANIVQSHLCDKLKEKNKKIKNRGTKNAPFYVLLGAEMPAIVVSPGFITNPTECNLLSSQEYQNYISIGIVNGIRAFIMERTTQPVTSPDSQVGAAVVD